MTVDMLAATFFWPEGTLLGSRHPQPDGLDDKAAAAMEDDHRLPSDEAHADGFWSAVMRHLWRSPARAAGAP